MGVTTSICTLLGMGELIPFQGGSPSGWKLLSCELGLPCPHMLLTPRTGILSLS